MIFRKPDGEQALANVVPIDAVRIGKLTVGERRVIVGLLATVFMPSLYASKAILSVATRNAIANSFDFLS